MTDQSVSRRFFLSAAAVAPAVSVVTASDRIAIFEPAPDKIKIVTSATSYVVPPPTFAAEEIAKIKAQGKSVEFTIPKNREELDRLLPEVDVVFGSINAEMLAKAKNLRWIQHTEAGMESVLFPELVKSQIVMTNTAKAYAPAISETAMSMLLALARGLNGTYIPQFEQKVYKPNRNLVEIDGMTMGIVAMGGLGSYTAQRAHYGFNMKILATDAKPMDKPIYVDTLREPEWFMEMVPQVDVLVSAAPATKETTKMFNAKVFGAMKKSAYFINISRGALVDEPALVAALKEGRIAGAGLDVTTPEPVPADSPLWGCPNLILTCHSAGFSPQRRVRQMALLTENVRRYANGLPLMNVVDKARGY
jgi:phosphoglycerate dehydrogenase-like enzyme